MQRTSAFSFVRFLQILFIVLAVLSGLFTVLTILAALDIPASRTGAHFSDWAVPDTEYSVQPITPEGGRMMMGPARNFYMIPFAAMQGSGMPVYIAGIFFQIMQYVCITGALWLITLIFLPLQRGEVFQPQVVRYVRWMALGVAGIGLFRYCSGWIFRLLLHDVYSLRTFAPGDHEWLALGALCALLIFGLGEIFRRAVQLQQEQNLTI